MPPRISNWDRIADIAMPRRVAMRFEETTGAWRPIVTPWRLVDEWRMGMWGKRPALLRATAVAPTAFSLAMAACFVSGFVRGAQGASGDVVFWWCAIGMDGFLAICIGAVLIDALAMQARPARYRRALLARERCRFASLPPDDASTTLSDRIVGRPLLDAMAYATSSRVVVSASGSMAAWWVCAHLPVMMFALTSSATEGVRRAFGVPIAWIVFGLFGGCIWPVNRAAKAVRQHYSAALAGRECPDCGYQLEPRSRLHGEFRPGPPRCPECGTRWPLVPMPTAAEVACRWWGPDCQPLRPASLAAVASPPAPGQT